MFQGTFQMQMMGATTLNEGFAVVFFFQIKYLIGIKYYDRNYKRFEN